MHWRDGFVLVGGLTVAACGSGTSPTQPPVADVAFTTQPPASVEGNVAIAPTVRVTIRDASGNLVPTGTVTMSIGTVPWPAPGSRLCGTRTVSANIGVATFADLRVDKPGAAYTLTAASGAARASSTPFDVRLTFTSLAAGGLHTCGLTTGGTYCWERTSTASLAARPERSSRIRSQSSSRLPRRLLKRWAANSTAALSPPQGRCSAGDITIRTSSVTVRRMDRINAQVRRLYWSNATTGPCRSPGLASHRSRSSP